MGETNEVDRGRKDSELPGKHPMHTRNTARRAGGAVPGHCFESESIWGHDACAKLLQHGKQAAKQNLIPVNYGRVLLSDRRDEPTARRHLRGQTQTMKSSSLNSFGRPNGISLQYESGRT